jgi:hypothetical protein
MILFFIFNLFPFSLESEFQNYLDMKYPMITNIIDSNDCRRHNFLYNGFDIGDEVGHH